MLSTKHWKPLPALFQGRKTPQSKTAVLSAFASLSSSFRVYLRYLEVVDIPRATTSRCFQDSFGQSVIWHFLEEIWILPALSTKPTSMRPLLLFVDSGKNIPSFGPPSSIINVDWNRNQDHDLICAQVSAAPRGPNGHDEQPDRTTLWGSSTRKQRFRTSVPILPNPPLLVTPTRIKQLKQLSESRVPTTFA